MMFKSLELYKAVRLLSIGWCAVLISLMATGTFSNARIGTLTWGPTHDVWSATIALSQINFGLSGKLGYKQIEQAIANEVTSSKNVWQIMDDQTRALLADPAAVTRGFRAGASVPKSAIVIPSSKFEYLANWCEDLGYADFYNLAFRIFGVSAYSTHWLYFGILSLTFALFVLAFRRDDVAIGTVTLAITALFMVSSSSIFSESIPSFSANRFLSTLAAIPLLHIFFTALPRRPLTRLELSLLVVQSMALAFAIAVRSSSQWCVLASILAILAIVFIRDRRNVFRQQIGRGASEYIKRLMYVPYVRRLATTLAIVVGVAVVSGGIRSALVDERYFMDDNLPHHLLWHSAYLGLTLNPQWPAVKPYADLPDFASDTVGFSLFERKMKEQQRPYLSQNTPFYLARIYEPFLRNQYLVFALKHPRYMVELFAYYKPKAAVATLDAMITSIRTINYLLALVSLTLTTVLLLSSARLTSRGEFLTIIGILWGASFLPVLWAYPSPVVIADQLWSTVFLGLVAASYIAMALILGIGAVLGARKPATSIRDSSA